MLCSTVTVVWVKLVVTDMISDGGGGVIPTVYMTSFPPFGGGVHSMVTVELPIPWMGRELLL
jgi:hypothetical protein